MDQLELTRAFRAGKLPVPDYVSQIESYFSAREPSILAFLPETERFARLCREAEALVSRFPDPGDRPPLFGILLGVKDIFHAGGYVTRAGSRLPAGELQGPEAESVTRLKHAGALILGKSVTTEFAYFTPGPTRNPHNPEHTPGGSSSGSAAAVGAGLCPLALGTQTIGSIIRPAAFCGVVGFKPTYERISRRGIIPLAPSLDHVGFFIPDLHLANPVARELIEDWRPVKMDRKPVLGIPEGPYLACASDYALACFDEICRILSEKGYELRRIRLMDDYQGVRDRHEAILSAEAAQVHKKWFEKYTGLYSLRFSDLVRRGQKITAVRLEKALHDRDVFRAGVAQAMQENQIDLWLAPPTIGPAPEGLDSTGDPVMALPWTQIGLPALNLPTGKSEHGLPMGLQVVGRWGMDEELLAWSGGIANVVSQR